MGGTHLTPGVLLQELMEVYEATSQEDLARKLNKPTRTVQRWFAGNGLNWDNAVELLVLAGRLQDGKEARAAADQERARRIAVQMAEQLEKLAELL